MTTATQTTTRHERFACFGTTVSIRAEGAEPALLFAVARARAIAFEVQRRLSRFDPDSELSRLNADPRERVPASALLRRFAEAVGTAGVASGGLVDATVLPAVEAAGYTGTWAPGVAFAPAAEAAHAVPAGGEWASVRVVGDLVVRPRGVRLDSGGLGKGLATDLMARALAGLDAWVVDCGGDVRLGGRAGRSWPVRVLDPIDPATTLATLDVPSGAAVATSGTTRRAWQDGHHLIDPRTGAPADTGIAQVTAVAPTGLDAEIRAKAALLSGPARAARTLRDGGVVVHADGVVELVPTA